MKKDLKVRFNDRAGFGPGELTELSFVVTELPNGKPHPVVMNASADFRERAPMLLLNDVAISTINWSDPPDLQQLEAAVWQACTMISTGGPSSRSYSDEWGTRDFSRVLRVQCDSISTRPRSPVSQWR